MTSRRTISVGTGGASTPDFYTEFANDLRDWFNAKSAVVISAEDPGIATGTPPPAASADWGPRINALINEIEQTNPIVGGVIEFYPEQKKISTTVDAFSGKKAITISSAGEALSGIFSSRGYGAGFYMGTSGMTMFKHNPGGSVNHWGPAFKGVVFSAEDFPTTGTLVDLQNVNYWSLDHCSFVYGNTQLKVDARLDLSGGNDASYGNLDRVVFSHYNSRGFQMVSGQVKANDLSWHQGVTGSWGMDFGPNVANSSLHGLKFDTLANGFLNKGSYNGFFHLKFEGALVGLRQDKDTSVSFSGEKNRYYDLGTTFRGAAGEVGIDVTSNVTQFNAVYGYIFGGTPGSGGAVLNDPNGLLMVVSDEWIDGMGPILKMPARFAAPAAPGAGGLMYFRAGAWRVRNGAGAEQTITVA